MEEQIYEAELVDEAAVSGSGATRSLNTALGATIAVVLVFLMMSRAIGAPLQDRAIEESLDGYTPIADRHLQNYYTLNRVQVVNIFRPRNKHPRNTFLDHSKPVFVHQVFQRRVYQIYSFFQRIQRHWNYFHIHYS